MDLFDYIKHRWVLLALLFVLGIVAIGSLGQRAGGTSFQARTELLVRPPTSELVTYASDLDRYIDTEMTLLFTDDELTVDVRGADVPVGRLTPSLTYTHAPGSETVTMTARAADADDAVEIVNAVAELYLASAQARAEAPGAQEAAALDARIKRAETQLTVASETIRRNAEAYIAANPERSIPAAAALSPQAAADQALLTGRLQGFYRQQADLNLDAGALSRSMVLTPATGATSSSGWGLTTYLAAGVGLLLLLMTAAGVGLALSKRVLGLARWNEAVSGGRVGRAIRLRRLTGSRRRQSVRRIVSSVGAVGTPGARVLAIYLPEKSPALRRKTAGLMKGMADASMPVHEVASMPALITDLNEAPRRSGGPARVLVVVDLARCQLDDAALLCNYPEAAQRLMVPVLI